jgi:diguanylate cyclase (GGDEF)-like protein
MMMDVDNFRQFNEAYGHPVGDEVLRRVGSVIRDSVRESDFAARYGGEEFVVILPETELNAAAVVAERVRSSLEAARVQTKHGALGVTTSIGIATSTSKDPLKSAALISAADGALYKAKRAGRNQVTLATKGAA